MIGDVCEAGMRVVLKTGKSSRAAPELRPLNGATGTLSHRVTETVYVSRTGPALQYNDPGVYTRLGKWIVKMDDDSLGERAPKGFVESGCVYGLSHFEPHPDSKRDYEYRLRELWETPVHREGRSMEEVSNRLSCMERVSDLPETKAWEGDTVKIEGQDEQEQFRQKRLVVKWMDYKADEIRGELTYSLLIYDFDGKTSGSLIVPESRIVGVSRGNVWKVHNGIPPIFSSIDEEADFYREIGQVNRLLHPRTNKNKWSLEEGIEALKNGDADRIFPSHRSYDDEFDEVSMISFIDRGVGERIRRETIHRLGIGEFEPVAKPEPSAPSVKF